MTDNRTAALPDGTDTVIEGAAKTDDTRAEDTALVSENEIPATRGNAGRSPGAGGAGRDLDAASGRSNAQSGQSGQGNIVDRLKSGREQLSSQAGEKARGLLTQGLERTSETLANVARMVGDTAPGIEERLGSEYGDYARRAAGSIENVANSIASKDPDELIEDTRNFVRNSPGVALAGAAVVGFVVARLLKTGLGSDAGEDDAA